MKTPPASKATNASNQITARFVAFFALLALALFGGALNTRAALKAWNVTVTGGAASGLWTTGPWNPTGTPAATDSAQFTEAITVDSTVTLSAATTIAQLQFTSSSASGGWIISDTTSMNIAGSPALINITGTGTRVSLNVAKTLTATSAAITVSGDAGSILALDSTGDTSGVTTWNVNKGGLRLGSVASLAAAVSGKKTQIVLGDSGNDVGTLILGDGSGGLNGGALSETTSAGAGGTASTLTAVGTGANSVIGGNAANTATMVVFAGQTAAWTDPINYGASGNATANNLALAFSGTSENYVMSPSVGNFYTGGLSISGKATTVQMGNANAFPAGDSLTIVASKTGIFDLNGNSVDVGALTAGGTTGSAINNSSSTACTMTIGEGNATCSVSGGSGIEQTGSGALGVTKVGTGTATFSVASTYSGTTAVNAGDLVLTTGGTIASSTAISIGASATLDVSGLTAALTLGTSDGLAATGTSAAGALVVASGKGLTTGASSPLTFTYKSGQAPLQVQGAAGNLNLVAGNATTVTVVGGQLASSASYLLVDNNGAGATVAGTAPTSVSVIGNGAAGTPSLVISGGKLWLNVVTAPSAYAITGTGTMNAGGSQTVTITALNGSGATLTSFSSTESITFSGLASIGGNNPTIGGTAFSAGSAVKSVTFASGVATFTLVAYDAQTTTLACTDGSATSSTGMGATGLALVVSPATASKLVMDTEPGNSVTAGAAFSAQPAVYVEDTYGNLESSDNSSVVTAVVGTGSGSVSGNTTATAASGIATFSGLNAPTPAQSGLKLSFTDTGDGTATLADSTSITVNPGTANKLAISQAIVSLQVDAQNFTPSPTVKVEDQYGNVVNSDSSAVTASIASHSGSGSLTGTLTANANGTSGTATFSALAYTLGSAATGETIQVQYNDGENGGLTAVNNSTVTVNPNLTLTFGTPPANTAAGATMASVVVNVVTVVGSTPVVGTPVALSIASGPGSFASGTLTENTDASGNATFSDLVIKTAGAYTLKAAVGLQSVTSGSFNINVGTYSQLQVLLPGQTAAPGSASGYTGTASNAHVGTGYTVTINAVDAYYNVVNTVANGITLAVSDSDSGMPTSGTLASGTTTATFTPTALNSSVTISAADSTASTTGTSTTFAVYHQNPYYRSTATGNWSAAATWQSSTDDGTTWATASVAPETSGNAADLVTIAGSGVTVTANTTLIVSNLVINAGNTDLVSGVTETITHMGGTGYPADDCDVSGTLQVSTTASSVVAESATPVVVFESGGAFVQGIAGGTMPAATWNAASTCIYAPTSASATIPAGLSQAFGNFVWNWTGQSGSAILAGAFGTGTLTSPTSPAGKITTTSGSATVAGTTTTFTTSLVTGDNIYDSNGDLVGTVLSIQSDTSLTLTANALIVESADSGWLASTGGHSVSGGSVAGNFDVTANGSLCFGEKPDTSGDSLTITIGGALRVHNMPVKPVAIASGGTVAGTYLWKLGGGIIVDDVSGDVGGIDAGNAGTNNRVTLEFTGNSAVYAFSNTAALANPQDASYQVDSSAVLTLDSPISSTNSSQGTFKVLSGGRLNCGPTNTITGGALGSIQFSLDSGATLETANTNGITASPTVGALGGSIQTTNAAGRSFSTGASYIFDGSSYTVVGSGLPTTVANLTLANGMTNSVTVVAPGTPGGTASSDTPVYTVSGTLTAANNIIAYTAAAKIIRGTYPVFDYGTLSGSFGTPTHVPATGGAINVTPTVSTGGGVVALTVGDSAPTGPAAGVTSNVITGASIKIPLSALLAAGSDFDGDPFSITAIDASTHDGATLTLDGGSLGTSTTVYVPATTSGDYFHYTLSDGIDTSTNITVTIDTVAGTGQQSTIQTALGGNVIMTFYGIPTNNYVIQETPNLTAPITWTNIPGSPFTATTNGLINATDTPAGGSGFYRLSTP